eukprot:jgi/Undpi1/11631/HiC_scaffold_35.g13926.m1
MATSLPWSLRLHAHQLARGSWRRGQDEGEIAKIREQLEGFDVELIFNMDETGLFYRCFPRGTYVTRVEGAAGVNKKTARGWKAMKAKDRCTVVACCNTTGSLKQSAWLDSSICPRWFDEVFVPFVKKTTGKKVALLPDNYQGHRIKNNDPQIAIIFLPLNVTSVFQPMDMGVLFALKSQYKTEMLMRLAALIKDWDTARARKTRRGCRGLSDTGQATLLDVTAILSQKWESFSDQTVIRCWLKATILLREHENALKGRDTRLGREDKEAAALDDLCDMVKMSMPESAKGLDARFMPRVLTDNSLVESASGFTEDEVRSAVNTWLSAEDDEEVLRAEVELEMEGVTENISKVHVEGDVSGDEEGDDGRQESCMKSTISEAEVRSRLEDVRSYLYANGRDGE